MSPCTVPAYYRCEIRPCFNFGLSPKGGSPYALSLNLQEHRMAMLQGKTLFIAGATRGIGHTIGIRAAQDGVKEKQPC